VSWLGTADQDPHDHSRGVKRCLACHPKTKRTGYRVDLWQHELGFYMEYTAHKQPVDLYMARALAQGLIRQGQGCRIMKVPEELVVEEHAVTVSTRKAYKDNLF
jgi:hypothetical protein